MGEFWGEALIGGELSGASAPGNWNMCLVVYKFDFAETRHVLDSIEIVYCSAVCLLVLLDLRQYHFLLKKPSRLINLSLDLRNCRLKYKLRNIPACSAMYFRRRGCWGVLI